MVCRSKIVDVRLVLSDVGHRRELVIPFQVVVPLVYFLLLNLCQR